MAHRRMDDWDPGRASARTWLHAIAVRVAANHRRLARFRREKLDDRVEPAPHEPDVAATIDQARMIARVYDVLSTLRDEEREVVVLFELQDLSMKEVAEILGCPIRTAYRRLEEARRGIARALAGKGGTR